MLQGELSGADNSRPRYTYGSQDYSFVGEDRPSALKVPTRIINTNQYYLPGAKIDEALKAKINSVVDRSPTNRRLLA